MTLPLHESIGTLAAQFPQAIPVFEQFHLDYCCGGQRSLNEACVLAEISTTTVLQALQKIDVNPLTELPTGPSIGIHPSATELIQYILEKHHRWTHEELSRLQQLALQVQKAHESHHPELAQVVDRFIQMADELEGHMTKEETLVFPYIQQAEKNHWNPSTIPNPFAGGAFKNHPLKVLMWEHGMTGEAWIELHQLTQDFQVPSDACRSYQQFYERLKKLEYDLHLHVHLENNVLFPKVMETGLLD